jgi:hypothetical protein
VSFCEVFWLYNRHALLYKTLNSIEIPQEERVSSNLLYPDLITLDINLLSLYVLVYVYIPAHIDKYVPLFIHTHTHT